MKLTVHDEKAMAPVRRKTFKSKTPFVRRRITRSYANGEMDFLPQLPEELQLMIFKNVLVNDLGRCLSVSKKWYNILNTDIIWKRHCLAHGIYPDEEKSFIADSNSTLCKWAQIWQKFHNSSSYGWRTCNWKTMEFNRGGTYMTNASDGKYIVFCDHSFLTVWEASQFSKRKYYIKLPFPSDAPSEVAVNDMYIAVARCNILLIYKLMKSQYVCLLALSLEDDTISKAYTAITMFVRSNFRERSLCICIFAFENGCIWMWKGGYRTYIINLIKNEISEVEPHLHRHVTQSHVVSWSRRQVRVDDFAGMNTLKLGRDIKKICANNKVIVTFDYNADKITDPIMETWDLNSGHLLLCLPRPKMSFIIIHPVLNILYRIDTDRECIVALCAVTGVEIWNSKVPHILDISDWCLRIVCKRYLVIFQFKPCLDQQSEVFVLDADNGQFLYKTDRPPGRLEHISDNLLITKTSSKIHVRTYLNSKS